jgi:cytochrome c biogenesis protein CcmG/thiol:disulfide interchange protein DsbE
MVKKPKSRLLIAALPLLAFILLAGVFWSLLSADRDPSKLPSVLIGKPAPDIELPAVEGLLDKGVQVPGVPLNVFAGKVSLVNFWASWCDPCKLEHPLIKGIARNEQVQMIGINYKNKPSRAAKFLEERGNPYDLIGADRNGRAAIEWGVYGMPETFLVDRSATIIFKHTGPVTPNVYKDELLPMIAAQF